jgi:hypothetical protein
MSKYPSKLRWVNSLARREANELLEAITDFANLGETAQDLRFFRKRRPDFLPSSLCDPAERNMKSWEGHVFQNFRRGVRDLWTGANRASYRAVTMLDIHGGGLSYVIDPGYKIAKVEFGWDWSSGEFVYASNVRFHQALFLLLGRRQLAKVCPQCSSCFLAKRGTQLYCSTDCSEIAEREWKREWWRKNGEAWRAARNRTSSEKKRAAKHPNMTAGGYVM